MGNCNNLNSLTETVILFFSKRIFSSLLDIFFKQFIFKGPEKDHVFLAVFNILTVCPNSQTGSRYSDLFVVFISKTDDKGVRTLLQ